MPQVSNLSWIYVLILSAIIFSFIMVSLHYFNFNIGKKSMILTFKNFKFFFLI